MNVRLLFEEELIRRGCQFAIDCESGRHEIHIHDNRVLVSLENLEREMACGADPGRISRFVDAVFSIEDHDDSSLSVDGLYWNLEPNDYESSPDFFVPMSDRVNRVLIHLSSDGSLVTWMTRGMLDTLGLSEAEASDKAFQNLGNVLGQVRIETKDVGEVRVGMFDTSLPFKASLILAPNLREIAESQLGWPLLAVLPDRDFLHLWAARHADFAKRVGRAVVREYQQAAYPISTEVYEICDKGIRAIGEFPKDG